MMAASTRRRHGHVAGLRRRPFKPADIDTPSGVIEELDEDEATTGPVDVAADPEDAVDAAAQPAAEDVREVSEPAEAGAEPVAEEEPTAEETAAVESGEPDTQEDAAEDVREVSEPAEAGAEMVAEEEPTAVETAAVESGEPDTQEDAAEDVWEVSEPAKAGAELVADEAPTVEETTAVESAEPDTQEDVAEDVWEVSEPANAGAELVADEAPTVEETTAVESAEPDTQEDVAEADTTVEGVAKDAPAQDEAVEDTAECRVITPNPRADLFAWLAGDGDSIADVRPGKPTQSDVPAGPSAVSPSPRRLARSLRLDRKSLRRAADASWVAPPPAPPVVVPPPPSPPPRSRPTRRGAILLAAVVVAVALVAGVVALLHPGSGKKDNGTSTQPRSPATTPPRVRTSAIPVVAWVNENLPSNAVMIAPAALVRSLHDAGFTAVHADDALTGLTLANVSYLVGEPAATTAYAPLELFLSATAPLAYFGTGSTKTMVGMVFHGGKAAMASAMVADTKLRAQEGSDLLHNPNVNMDAAMRKILANGLLDARAGALIGALAAGARQVTITDPQRVAAEAAARLPYRTFTLSMANTVFLDKSVHRADPKYRPARAVALGPTQRRLTWTPAIAPDTPFG